MKKNYMLLSKAFTIVLLNLLSVICLKAQTTLISGATGNGNFETGTASPWVIVNGTATNMWQISTAATAGFGGTYAAYISNSVSAPFTHTYTTSSTSIVHLYQDVTIPAGEGSINLSFKWIGGGESGYDFIKVYAIPISTTPVSGTALTSGQIGNTAGYNGQATTWQTASGIPLPSSFAGSTVRLVFTWQNDASGGTQPPGAIDDVTLTSACTGVTGSAATNITPTSAQANWIATPGATGYNVRYKKTTDPTTVRSWTTPLTVTGGATLSTLLSSLSSGSTYEYQVSAIGTSCASYGVSITFVTGIANDDCANAVLAMVNTDGTCTNTISGTLAGATASSGPTSTCGTYDDDVWYKFVATAPIHTITLQNIVGSTTDLTFQVLNACGANATVLLCSDPETNTITGLAVGTTYYIRVASYTSTTGQNSTFDLCVSVPPNMVYTSSTATQQTGTVNQGSVNNPILRLSVVTTNSGNPLSVSQLVLNTNGTAVPADLTNARVFYTGTSTTFASTTQFGTVVANPNGTLTFNGSQPLVAGTNYFWLAYDVSCIATITDVIDAEFTSVTVGGTAYTPTTTAPTGNKTIASSSGSFSTIADGNWNNTATWACGNIPNSSTVAIIINNNITVNSVVDSSGSITIAAGKTLTIAAGSLTSGRSSAGTLAGNSNQLLTINGTLTVTGGTFNMNGGITVNTTGALNMTGGILNIDPNDGTSAGSYAGSNGTFYILSNLLNITGGAINILDPAYPASTATSYNASSRSINFSTSGLDTTLSPNCVVTLGGGDDVNPLNLAGFYIECNTSTGTLGIGNIVVNSGRYSAQRHASTNTSSVYITKFRNLTINSGSEFVINSAPLAITGNLINNGVLTTTSTAIASPLAMVGDAQYSGGVVFSAATAAQSVSGTGIYKYTTAATDPTSASGNLIGNFTMFHDKSSPGVTVNVPMTITGTLRLAGGKVIIPNGNLFALGHGTSISGNSATLVATTGTLYGFSATAYTTTALYNGGWVSGLLNRWVTATTTTGQQGILPVGSDTSRPAQVLFSAAPTTGGYLTSSWIDGNSVSLINPTLSEPAVTPNTINKVTNAMWQITNAGTLTGGTYDATFTNTQANGILDFANTTLLKRATATAPWAIEGTHVASTGSNSSITVKRTGLTTFSQFAIGGGNTALPISLTYLKGQKTVSGNALNWKVNCTSTSITMELERSADSRSFKAITSITATQVRCGQPFDYTDAIPLKGTNYYRLKMIDVDGKITYSPIVAIINGSTGAELVGIYPTVVRDEAFLSVAASRSTKMQINITDISGRVIKTINQTVANGSTLININTAQLSTGVYNITGMLDGVQTKTLRFVKQ